jgi:hypothetical protein
VHSESHAVMIHVFDSKSKTQYGPAGTGEGAI